MDRSSAPALVRTGSIAYTQRHWRARVDLRNFQQLNQIQPDQYELLPQLSVIGDKQFGRLATEGRIQLSEFDHSEDNRAKGSRSVVDAKISLPFANSWGYFNPSVRLVYRDYNLDDVLVGQEDSASVANTIAALDTGLVFEREYSERTIQTLEPRLHYLSVDEEFQANIPSFDSTPLTPSYHALFRDIRYTGYDRIGDANRFALGLTTRYLDSTTGQQRFSASVGQIFHLDDREVNFGNTPGVDPTADSSPLFLELSANINRWQMLAAYEFDGEESRSNRGHLGIRYRGKNSGLFNFTYAMTDESVQRNLQLRSEEESDVSFVWPITPAWQLIGRWNYGWDTSQTIESLFGVEYNDCCWKARIVYRRSLEEPRVVALTNNGGVNQFVLDRRADSGIYFEFLLKGLGSLGGRLDSLLSDSIPAYRPTE